MLSWKTTLLLVLVVILGGAAYYLAGDSEELRTSALGVPIELRAEPRTASPRGETTVVFGETSRSPGSAVALGREPRATVAPAAEFLPPRSAADGRSTTEVVNPSRSEPRVDSPAAHSLASVEASASGQNQTPIARPPGAQQVVPAPRKLPLPLAFADIDPVASGLNNEQIATLAAMREKFISDIGGLNQNTADPGYAKRWMRARPANDAELRLFFGAAFAEQIALQAAQAEQATASVSR